MHPMLFVDVQLMTLLNGMIYFNNALLTVKLLGQTHTLTQLKKYVFFVTQNVPLVQGLLRPTA